MSTRNSGVPKRKKSIFFVLLLLLLMFLLTETLARALFFQEKGSERLALLHYLGRLVSMRSELGSPKKVGIWETDERLGLRHRPGAQGSHESSEFRVSYTIDSGGNRITPARTDPSGRVLMLGGSNTFGHGVEDDEAYPYVLAMQHWRKRRVVNGGVMGSGAPHAYLIVSEELGSEAPPSLILYAMIPGHIRRSYIRSSWVDGLAGYGRTCVSATCR